jgi:hypothetical protein
LQACVRGCRAVQRPTRQDALFADAIGGNQVDSAEWPWLRLLRKLLPLLLLLLLFLLYLLLLLLLLPASSVFRQHALDGARHVLNAFLLSREAVPRVAVRRVQEDSIAAPEAAAAE